MPTYRIRGGNRVTYETLDSFRAQIPKGGPFRVSGSLAKRIRLMASDRNITEGELINRALGLLENNGFPGCGRHNKGKKANVED